MTDTTDIAALVERLRDMDRVHVGIRNEAAALIEAQAATIASQAAQIQALERDAGRQWKEQGK